MALAPLIRDRALWVALCALFMSACIYDGLVADDETGFSRGPGRNGMLYDGPRLPIEGTGYWIPPRWSTRGLNFGVDELVSLIVYTGRALHQHKASNVLSVADLSRAIGGRSQWHRSHQTGRDVDFLFFVADKTGRPVVVESMFKFDIEGAQRVAKNTEPVLFFDVATNWQLVRILIENPIAEVQYIFIQDDLKQLLLEYALSNGASKSLVARASYILRQPSDSAPHDDHFHVRIFCPHNDLQRGCVDFGQLRWHKRDYKYEQRIQRDRRYAVPKESINAIPWLWR